MSRTEKTLITGSTRFLTIAALFWVLVAPATAVEVPADRDWGPTLAVLHGAPVEAVLFPPAPAKAVAIDGPSAQADCTAKCCNDSSTVTCSGSWCSAQDADCDNDVRGYCESDEEGTKYCPDCSWQACTDCSGEPRCEWKNGTSCDTTGEEADCSFQDDSCGDCFCDGVSWVCTL